MPQLTFLISELQSFRRHFIENNNPQHGVEIVHRFKLRQCNQESCEYCTSDPGNNTVTDTRHGGRPYACMREDRFLLISPMLSFNVIASSFLLTETGA